MPENNNIKSDAVKLVARGQAVVEARHPLEKEAEILSATATVTVRPTEVFAGEARYAGKVGFDCYISCEDKVECVTVLAEFTDKISAPEIAAGMRPVISPEVVNCEAKIENGAIKAIAVVDTSLYAVVGCEAECLTEPEEGIYVERKAIEYCTEVASPTDTAYVNDGISVKAAEVLCQTARAVVNSAECADGEVKISGTVYTFVTLRSEDGAVSSVRVVTPLVKSVAAVGVTPDDKAFARCFVTDCAATLIADEESKLEVSATVEIAVNAFACKTTEAVVDVFCADSELETDVAQAEICTVEPLVTVADTVDGQIKLESDMPAADGVLCVANTFCTLTDVNTENRRVNVEGLVGGDIIYYSAEKNAVYSVAFRLPFSMPLSINTDAASADVSATVTDVAIKIRRESVFDVKAEIAFTAALSTCESVSFVRAVKRGEAIARPDATVIVHIARPGETLWQAAKALGCSPERVTEQNETPAPYKGGERLVNFCGK
ncbi:MAG: DUF3794 domain-containing protein [Clostridia bacterium]|jgi:hypothetical protein|nr:DUF3794 domain-containing protein [Clostridia bacterium]MCI9459150.1 DUF3794 domain-containing protein [Clostridia bacterium]